VRLGPRRAGQHGPHATDPEIELTDLESGTYVCTMVVDP
jgi:hypothetical protein